MASYLDARAHAGTWILRVEDLDRQREIPGAADTLLRTLESFGFEWDGSVVRQSQRTEAYALAVETLRRKGLVYPCGCSRREIAAAATRGPEGPIYPGTCRGGMPPGRRGRSLRIHVDGGIVALDDSIQGRLEQDIGQQVGDFIIRRADGIHAYQLAVVIDDAWQDITDVVRGADLVASTPRQIFLQRCLTLPTPRYAHVPLAVDRDGRKLSKSTRSMPVDPANPLPALLHAWRFLDQPVFAGRPASSAEFWDEALRRWDISAIQPTAAKPVDRPIA